MSAWDNFVDNLKRPFKTFDRENSNYFYNTQQALGKMPNSGYTSNFQPWKVSNGGLPDTVFAGYGGQKQTDQQPNFMNLVLLGLGAYLIIKILD